MACQPWGIPRGRGVQTQARAAMACPPLSFLPTSRSAIRRSVPYSQARRPAIRRCNCPSPSTLTRQSAIRRCYYPTSSSRARQSAIRRCRAPPNPLPPCPGPVHVDWGLPARATRLTTHSPTLRTGFIADGTPKSSKRPPRPSSESVGLQSSSAGVRSRALVLLGSLHAELSSWRRGNPPPPPATRATTGTGGSGGGLVHFTPHPRKTKHMGATHPCSSAHCTCTRTGRWEAPSGIRRDRWETTDPRVRTSSFAARARCATSRAAAF